MFRSNIFLLCAFCAHVHAQKVEFVVMDYDEGWELDEYFFFFPLFLFAVKWLQWHHKLAYPRRTRQ